MTAQMQIITVPLIACIQDAGRQMPFVAMMLQIHHNGGGYGMWNGWCLSPLPDAAVGQERSSTLMRTSIGEVCRIEITSVENLWKLDSEQTYRIEFKGVGQPPKELAKFVPVSDKITPGPLDDLVKLDDDAPTFRITCLKCGSTDVKTVDDRRYYDSGGTGSLDLQCQVCKNSQTIQEAE